MTQSAFRSAFPYLVGLAIAALLYFFAQQIEYTPRPGVLGPDVWPKAAIVLMAVACAVEIARAFIGSKHEPRGVAEVLEGTETEETPPSFPGLLVGGIVLTAIYALVVDTLGFLLATFLFLTAFMYIGRYRNHVAIWSISAAVTFLAALVFIRFAYVSLPRGAPPFDAITDVIRTVLGG
jgi:hypothetical protein